MLAPNNNLSTLYQQSIPITTAYPPQISPILQPQRQPSQQPQSYPHLFASSQLISPPSPSTQLFHSQSTHPSHTDNRLQPPTTAPWLHLNAVSTDMYINENTTDNYIFTEANNYNNNHTTLQTQDQASSTQLPWIRSPQSVNQQHNDNPHIFATIHVNNTPITIESSITSADTVNNTVQNQITNNN